MIDIEPVKWISGNGKVRWQPQLNGARLYWSSYYGNIWTPVNVTHGRIQYRTRSRARRAASREWNRRQRNNWSEASA